MSDEEEGPSPYIPLPSEEGDAVSESDGINDGELTSRSSMPISAVAEKRGSRHIWLISYADFMTILMIFFLAMYGYTYLAKETLLRQHPQLNDNDFSNQIASMKDKLGSQLKVQEDTDKVILQVDDQILFASGRAELNENAASTIDDLAKSVMLLNGDVIVQGHTDNVPVVAGRYHSNWELSAARSFSMINALQRRGVPLERLAAWGFGEHRPLVENDTAEGRAQNRRIDVVILKKKQAAKEG